MSSTATMSSARSSNSPPASVGEPDEPRKKGSRGGKRSVTHLSKAQLARKRTNDREAQRNIRQRTKEHIETLEKKVKELESGGRSSSMERVLKRNHELEEEIQKLKNQLSQHTSTAPVQVPPDIPGELLIPQKVTLEWMPQPEQTWPTTSLPTHIPSATVEEPTFPMDGQAFTAPTYDESENPQQLYTPEATPLWSDSMVFGGSQSVPKPAPAWVPFHPALPQPSQCADLRPSRFPEVINTNTNSNCWQSQPSIYAWQISTKLKAPVSHVDQLIFSTIQSQRHLYITSDLSGEDVIGPEFPSVHLLFNQPGPAKPSSALTEVMAQYSAVLSNRGFKLIPEKLASFMSMYRFVQWQISPTYETYQAMFDSQIPRPAQLMIAHPAWMDLPPWPKFRERIIENQDRYDNAEFQNDYVTNLNVNFPYDPMKAVVFEEGQIKVSKIMERQLNNLANISMKKPFADKYPELRDVCRFDEV